MLHRNHISYLDALAPSIQFADVDPVTVSREGGEHRGAAGLFDRGDVLDEEVREEYAFGEVDDEGLDFLGSGEGGDTVC